MTLIWLVHNPSIIVSYVQIGKLPTTVDVSHTLPSRAIHTIGSADQTTARPDESKHECIVIRSGIVPYASLFPFDGCSSIRFVVFTHGDCAGRESPPFTQHIHLVHAIEPYSTQALLSIHDSSLSPDSSLSNFVQT